MNPSHPPTLLPVRLALAVSFVIAGCSAEESAPPHTRVARANLSDGLATGFAEAWERIRPLRRPGVGECIDDRPDVLPAFRSTDAWFLIDGRGPDELVPINGCLEGHGFECQPRELFYGVDGGETVTLGFEAGMGLDEVAAEFTFPEMFFDATVRPREDVTDPIVLEWGALDREYGFFEIRAAQIIDGEDVWQGTYCGVDPQAGEYEIPGDVVARLAELGHVRFTYAIDFVDEVVIDDGEVLTYLLVGRLTGGNIPIDPADDAGLSAQRYQ